jgi:CHAT domain-containing protein
MGKLFADNRPVTASWLQCAMKTIRNSPGRLSYRAHPAFWAPFVLVGDTP